MRNNIISIINKFFDKIERFKNLNPTHSLIDSDLYIPRHKKPKWDTILIFLIKYTFSALLGLVTAKIVSIKNLNYLTHFESFIYLISVLAILIFIYFLRKIVLFSYRISLNQGLIIVFFTTFYFYLRYLDKINCLHYYDYFVGLILVIVLGSLWNYGWPKYGKALNMYYEDNPPMDEKELNEVEKRILEKLKVAILKDKYQFSFSIGIIGSWGLGKSTFLNYIKKELKNYKSIYDIENQEKFFTSTPKGNLIGKQKILTIQYSPFLNHSEENLIEDFFIQLSNQLKNYSGSLSRKINKYAESVISAMDNNNLKIIQELLSFQFGKEASDEIYNDIKENIEQLELKIIVFIDDLDRLNPKEIIQILKLIRNTSNFPNFVFIVAMDKEYVISALSDLGDYTGRNFIDKFFQLECHLPEIEAGDLRNEAIRLIDESNVIEQEYLPVLKGIILGQLPLFAEYVQNYRDVKRFVNQLHFEYNLIMNLFQEIDIRDYLNLLMLKMKFPGYYKVLMTNFENSNYLNNKNGIISLPEVKKKETSEKTDLQKVEELIKMMPISKNNVNEDKHYTPDLSLYEFDYLLSPSSEEDIKTLYDIDDKHLIKRTLVLLFGNINPTGEDETPLPRSIQWVKNLRKISYLRVSKSDLSSLEYNELFQYYKNFSIDTQPNERNLFYLKQIIEENKLDELIGRLKFEVPENEEQIITKLFIVFDIYRVTELKITYLKINQIINEYYIENKENNKIIPSKETLKRLFEENFIKVTDLDPTKKLEYIHFSVDYQGSLWIFNKEDLIELNFKLLTQKINKINTSGWEKNDKSIFYCYDLIEHSVNGESLEKLNNALKEFLKNKDLRILFFNILDSDGVTLIRFKLNKIIQKIFDSTEEFMTFLTENYSGELNKYPKIVEFLKLNHIVKNDFVKYNFNEEILIGEFPHNGIYHQAEKKRIENQIHLFFEFSFINLTGVDIYQYHINKIDLKYKMYYVNQKPYLLIILEKASSGGYIVEILNDFISMLSERGKCHLDVDEKGDHCLKNEKDKIIMQLISKQ